MIAICGLLFLADKLTRRDVEGIYRAVEEEEEEEGAVLAAICTRKCRCEEYPLPLHHHKSQTLTGHTTCRVS
jgi:hypothetical protein